MSPADSSAAASARPGLVAIAGFAAGTALVLEAVSGVALALHYVPSPELAHASLLSVETELPHGAGLRALHHWGAHGVVALVLLTLALAVLRAAYRGAALRWCLGLGMFAVVFAATLTGELLPWNEQGWFATQVRTGVATLAPGGEVLREIVLGGDELAAPALTRFYVLHVVVLPAMLVALWLLLVRGKAPAGATPRTWSWPQAGAGLAVGLLAQIAFTRARAPLGGVVEPGDPGFEATPDWHSAWLHVLLEHAPPSLQPAVAVWLPLAMALGAVALPWLDRGAGTRSRKAIVAAIVLGPLALAALSLPVWLDPPQNRAPLPYDLSLTRAEREGYLLLRRNECLDCHAWREYGKTDHDAPTLDEFDGNMSADEFARIVADPVNEIPADPDAMPAYDHLSYEQRRAIGLFLRALNADDR